MSSISSDLIDRTRSIAPSIAEAARRAELQRKPDDTIIELLKGAEIFRALVPSMWGGLELDLATQLEIVEIVSAADMSTGWITSFYMGHNAFVTRFSEQAQADVFAGGPDTRVPATTATLMAVEAVTGGFEISGQASWGSGIIHADWVIVGGNTGDGILCFLVPVSDTSHNDAWNMSGMSGTGSNDIVIERAFVPHYRALSMAALLQGKTPGGAIHNNPLYTMPLMPFIYSEVCGVFSGGLRGALRQYKATTLERLGGQFGKPARERPHTHIQLGSAIAASLVADDIARAIVSDATVGLVEGFDLEKRLTSKAKMGFLVDHCRRTMNEMMNRAGAASFRTDEPIQRFFRDINTVAIHAYWDWETGYEQIGRHQAQLPPNHPLI